MQLWHVAKKVAKAKVEKVKNNLPISQIST
nr:MAG TPA: hypothetical protein [Caudoviricetes sp.]DAY62413.1 MAG TPA: hypothetical protein [Caudoviricetes sp.]